MIFRSLVPICIAFATVVGAYAQVSTPSGPAVPSFGDIIKGHTLLRRLDVQRELKLTTAQLAAYKKSAAIMYDPSSKYSPSQQRSQAQAVKKMLTKAQLSRLEQLALQAQGTFALSSESCAKQVGLTEAQKKKIYDIRVAGLAKFQEERKREGKAYKPNPATTKWIMDGIYKVMTRSQRTTWAQMLGKPFQFNPRLPGR